MIYSGLMSITFRNMEPEAICLGCKSPILSSSWRMLRL
jgi:hypothetical protein